MTELEKKAEEHIKKHMVECVEEQIEYFRFAECSYIAGAKEMQEELRKEISETDNALDMVLEENEHLKRDNGLLAKRGYELQSDLAKAKSQIEKMKTCANCKYCKPLGDCWCCTLTENYCRVYPRETKICEGWELVE